MAEAQLEIDMRARISFTPSTYFEGLTSDPEIQIKDVYARYLIQGPDGKKGEIDLRIDSADGIILLVEIKKTRVPSGEALIAKFASRVTFFVEQHPDKQVLSGFLSLGGFTKSALDLCQEQGMGTASSINYLHKQWK